MNELKEIKPDYPDDKLPQKIFGGDLHNAPYKPLTAATGGNLTSGGISSLSNGDNAILSNAITRIGEIETALKKLGLIK